MHRVALEQWETVIKSTVYNKNEGLIGVWQQLIQNYIIQLSYGRNYLRGKFYQF